MKIVFFLALFVNLFFGYEAYQNTASSPQASYHPLYEERRNRLLGVYGTFNKVESDANLNISGFASQNHDLSEKPFGFGLQMGYLLSQNHRILVNFENTLKKMIEVLDNFERGLKAIETVEDCDKVKECYNLAYKNFTEVLTKAGLESIKAEGEQFDPNFHEAVMQTPTSEKPEHTILAELQKGYKLGDKVLRPTLVNVAVSE